MITYPSNWWNQLLNKSTTKLDLGSRALNYDGMGTTSGSGTGGGVDGSAVANSRGSVSPFAGLMPDYSKGVPAGLMGNSGMVYDPYLQGGGGYISQEDASNANSAANKYGTRSPSVDQAQRTLVPLDIAARAYASGVQPTWSSNGWNAPDPPNSSTYGYQQQINSFYELLKQLQQPRGTPALNLYNQLYPQ